MSASETCYDREWCDLPPVAEGDEVEISYICSRPSSGNRVPRTGKVVAIHYNGFTIDRNAGKDTDEEFLLSVRCHYYHDRDETEWSVDTVRRQYGEFLCVTPLNKDHRDPDLVTIEVK